MACFRYKIQGAPTLGPPRRRFEVRAIRHCKLEGRMATLREGSAKVTLEGWNGPDEEPRKQGVVAPSAETALPG